MLRSTSTFHVISLSIILFAPSFVSLTLASDSQLEIHKVEFDPIAQGKNIVRVEVSNNSHTDRVFSVSIYTRSPEYGARGVGWGTSFYETVEYNNSKWMRFAFKIQGPITESTWMRFKFYDVGPANEFDENSWNAIKAKRIELDQRRYRAGDLNQRKDQQFKQASQDATDLAHAFFEQVQLLIRNKHVQRLWRCFTEDYQQAEFQNRISTLQAVLNKKPPHSIFYFDPDEILALSHVVVKSGASGLRLVGHVNDQTIYVDLVNDEEVLKVDWIGGYIPQVVKQQDWQQRLLPRLEKKTSEHFDLYYFKDSAAAKDINDIAQYREKAYSRICQFVGANPGLRLRCVFFQDEQAKFKETGHQGKGWAFGNTIVEVYNQQVKLDPYHETVHALTRHLGNPPALFSEGIAVYMAEELGAEALLHLGGGNLHINDHLNRLEQKGKWIELAELLCYDNIGSQGDMTTVAYTEAASFVKFLVEKHGKPNFLKTYGTLKNSSNKNVQQQNMQKLEEIYRQSVQELQDEWIDHFSQQDDVTR